jgi:hypothetical protein
MQPIIFNKFSDLSADGLRPDAMDVTHCWEDVNLFVTHDAHEHVIQHTQQPAARRSIPEYIVIKWPL